MDIWSLHQQGFSQRAIAKKLGISRHTVAKYLESGERQPYNTENRHSSLEPFHQMIQDWLAWEKYSASRVHAMVQCHGYTGSYQTTTALFKNEG